MVLAATSVAPLHGLRVGAVLSGYRSRATKSDVPVDVKALQVQDGKSIELTALCKKLGLTRMTHM